MIIQEFLPNPAGKDAEGEYVLLLNDSDAAMSLSGWKIKDASGKSFSLSGTVAARSSLRLTAAQTKINLNNTGETIFLVDASGQTIDSLSYTGSAAEDIPVVRAGQLTQEVRNKLFDDLPGKFLPDSAATAGSVWLVMVICALFLAAISVYIVSNVKKDPYQV